MPAGTQHRAPALACLFTIGTTLLTGPVLAQTSAPVTPAKPAEIEEIVVTGIRASLTRSLDVKRDSGTIVDAITAEELGKFADRNVAESLGHIAGVSVRRTRGAEGQFVSIRGLGQGFSVVTLNERILPTDNSGREFSFDVLPSEMISGAEVYKAVEATQLEGSIGGGVNLWSARPFDSAGLTTLGSVEADYNDLADSTGYKLTGVVSNRFADDTIGGLLSIAYSERDLRTDNLREYFIVGEREIDAGADFNGNGLIDDDGESYVYPTFYSPGVVLGKRKRLGVSGALQFRPRESLDVTIDGLYSHYDTPTKNYAESNYLGPNDEGNSRFLDESIQVDANNVVTNFAIDDLVAEVLTSEEPRTVDTYQFGANVQWQASERLQLAVDSYWASATRDSAGKERFVVAGIPGSTGIFATRPGELPDFDITIPGDRPLSDATFNDYRSHFIGIFGADVQDDIYGAKVDATWELSGDTINSLQFGVNYSQRDKQLGQVENVSTSCTFCGYPFTFGEINADIFRSLPVSGLLSQQGGNFPRNFATFNIDEYLAALALAENNPNVLDPATNLPYPTGTATQIVEPLPVQSFDIGERTMGVYVQLNLEHENWRGNLGLRLINTDVSSRGAVDQIVSITKQPNETANYDVVRSPATPVSGGGDYTRLLPSLNVGYDLTDTLRLRFAASQAISRPSIDQLSAASNDNAETGDFTKFNFGNPSLRPTEAKQADLSLEWYFAPGSTLSGAVFYKDIKNFITTGVDQEEIAGQTFTVITVNNGDSGDVKGLEITYQQLFDSGFGLGSGVTWTDSSARFGEIRGELEDVTPFSFDGSVLYEKDRISAKVSYSYDDARTAQLDGFVEGLSVIADSYEELSFSVSYRVTDSVAVYVEGSNLLDETERRFNTYRNVPAFYEENGRSWFFGVRGKWGAE